MGRRKNDDRKLIKASHEEMDNDVNETWAPWANLIDDLLVLILMQLHVIDYLAFGGVCKSWRSVALVHKENFLAPQQPFIVLVSSHAKRACSLYNMFDGRTCKTMLPDLAGRSCWGFSCGYLIMQDREFKPWLVNLITRQELHFPSLPLNVRTLKIPSLRAILVYSTMLSDFVMVGIHTMKRYLLYCRPGDVNWAVFSLKDQSWESMDLAVFKGKLYVLARDGRIGELELSYNPVLKVLDVNRTPTLSCTSVELVTSNKRLFMVDFLHPRRIGVYELDFASMEWVKTENLGEDALFLNGMKCDSFQKNHIKCSAVLNPTLWGGSGNCIYIFESFCKCAIYSLDGTRLISFQVVPEEEFGAVKPFSWYFPHQCCEINLLHDGTCDRVN